ncbi:MULTISPECIES: flagellar hook-length control protein FliK [unclassified Paenibacillus]|uniref:flagellar hook-length control protein FliK n=1 Tax=unclassified Paenibacillus TaxID=185978 RepID=UPI000FE22CAC|nr:MULTISPECIES: flagellar hook-length control protein FliK [unclassified Paenibacillus]MCM3175294.1 flagellar hook-length control protein FliK [Paenibacillus sp. MER 99-2]
MSIVYQMTTASSAKATATNSTTGTQAKGATTAPGGEFMQTLAASLNGGTTEGSNAAASGMLSVNPLVVALASSEEDEQSSLTDILNSLFSDLEPLDEAIEQDPSLLAELQILIQQMYAQITDGTEQESGTTDTDVAPEALKAVPAINLTEHPTVARFVLQDALTQMATNLVNPDGTLNKNTSEFKNLLQNLQNHLQNSGVDLSSSKGWADLKSIVDTLVAIKDQNVQVTQASTGQALNKQDAVISQLLIASAAGKGTQATMETGTNSSVTASTDVELDHSTVITAGELSMRTSGTSAAKPAEPVMQASQFAKEMTQFVVNKLDIVQKNGFSEATISLRPEHLGKLDVQITLQNGQLVARFMTEHTMARDMLEQQMMQLRSSLQAQGIQVERLEVTQNSSLGSQMYQDGGRQPGSNSQQQRRSREREEQSDDAITTAGIQEELRNWRSEQVEGQELKRDSFTAEA